VPTFYFLQNASILRMDRPGSAVNSHKSLREIANPKELDLRQPSYAFFERNVLTAFSMRSP
jgi:hypothetical protein